jgi:hypothetical protein
MTLRKAFLRNELSKGEAMMRLVIGTFAAVALCVSALAQDMTPRVYLATLDAQENQATTQSTQPSSRPPSGAPRFAPDTVIPVELTKSVDAKKAKTGDGVEARVTQDLKAGNGLVIIPKDTKVVGRVTEAQARNKEQKESEVGILFDRAVLKNGSDVPIAMSIQAIIAPAALSAGSNNNAGADSSAQSPQTSAPAGMSSGNSGGRSTGMATGSPSSASPSTTGGEAPAAHTGAAPHEPITANTQGIVGLSNLNLSTTGDTTKGSVVRSEKSNVKLESGTFMLLRVNQ